MNGYDLALIGAVLAALALAVRACLRARRRGGCCGNCAACSGCAGRGGK